MGRLRRLIKEAPTPRRFFTMADVMRRSRPVEAPPRARVTRARDTIVMHEDDVDVVCDTCGSCEHEDKLLLCDRCGHGRHTFCLRPVAAEVPDGPWFCSDDCACAPPVKRFKRR
nr:unnamed protein product [Digitaria exilis]